MTESILHHSGTRQRAEALLSRMSLEQKIGQMTMPDRMSVSPEEVRDYHIGAVLSGSGSCPGDNQPADWVAMNDAYWAASMSADENHLAIPIIYGVDANHGHSNVRGATVFPHNIGLGAANEPGLLRRIARITAREVLATGLDWTFAPAVSVARDIHWGRTYESFSENTAIVTLYAGEYVQSLQDNFERDGVLGCVKHWVGDGGTRHGIDQGEVKLGMEELESVHILPYRRAIEAGVLTVMVSFSSWNGDKCHGHKYLVTEVLKKDLQFDGYVISDWDGIDFLSEDYHDAVALAVNAGIDMFMISERWKEFIKHLKRHVQRGHVSMKRIDDAVRRILMVKIACGLFEKPRPMDRFWSNHDSFGCPEHRRVAREAVRKSLVLLKNENSILPLNKDARIFVAGKNADNLGHQCGGFSIAWQGTSGNVSIKDGSSVWRGISQVAENAYLSRHKNGADADPSLHDVAIIVVGETPYAEGLGDIRDGNHLIVEAGSQIKGVINVLQPYGQTLELASLHPEDLQTILTVTGKGIPAIVVLISGRPLVVNRELEASSAFVAAWLPGSEGQGIADVLFGDFDFQGKLSFSWPADSDNVPTGYRDTCKPLFPLGYGLSYMDQGALKSAEG
jgi:beta-glucosidase